jgi:chemosensory pili system protein ChpA (sensor histidine kinase/response regulator)
MKIPVGASLLAMDVNDNACRQEERSAYKFIASKLAPTEK